MKSFFLGFSNLLLFDALSADGATRLAIASDSHAVGMRMRTCIFCAHYYAQRDTLTGACMSTAGSSGTAAERPKACPAPEVLKQ